MMQIILPVKNEGKTVKKTAVELFTFCEDNYEHEFRIIFIDDDSSDDTIQKILELNNKHISVIKNKFDNGKGSALKTGFILSSLTFPLEDNDLVCFMDGDGQINPKEIKTLLNSMEMNCSDVAIGNKRHTFSLTKYSFLRKIVSSTYNFLIRLLFGFNYQDTQCGIKIFKKYALDLVIENITCKKYAFDLELIVALREMSLRVSDAPVTIKAQLNSGSVNLKNIFRTFFDTLSIWNRMRQGFYR